MNVTGRLKQRFIASRVAHSYPQAQSKFVEVDGSRLHFVIKGHGQPIVLIHGNPGSCQDWGRLYGPVSERYCAFAFDRPGHGHSERPNHRDITVEVQAEMLHSALKELGVERPILVGHSWGAALVLAFALEFPNELSGAVLLAPAAYEGDDGVSFLSKIPGWPIIGDVVNFIFTPLLSAWLVRSDLTKAFAPDSVPGNYMRHALTDWTRPKKVKWYSIDDALFNESIPKLTPRYSEIGVPVAIVTGDSDQIVPPDENAHRLSETLPDAELLILAKAGHQIQFTRPEAVMRAVDGVVSRSVRTDSLVTSPSQS